MPLLRLQQQRDFVINIEPSILKKSIVLIRENKIDEVENLLIQHREQLSNIDVSTIEVLLWAHQGHYQAAYSKAREVLNKIPNDPDIRFYMARLAVALGAWQEGLELLDSVRGAGLFGGPFLTNKKPLWSRESLVGKTIFLASEGGLGDTICFARFAANFSKLGARVILAGTEPLFPLLRKIPGVSAVVEISAIEKTDFDYWIPALSCPRLLGLELNQIHGEPYLDCLPYSNLKWQTLSQSSKPKIALVWQGDETFPEDNLRSISAEKLESILSHDEFQFFSIRRLNQKNSIAHKNLKNVGENISDPQDLAAFLSGMDLVISIDSGPAHLAGAMGVPTILLNREMGWFTFGAEPNKEQLQTSPWYQSMAVLHQKHGGQWLETLERAEQVLLSKNWPKSLIRRNLDEIYHPESPLPSLKLVELTDTKYGPMLTVPNDYFVGKALELYGEYSVGEEAIFRKHIKTGDHIVEAGAHLGALTILFAQLVGPQGSVLAFEPQELLRSVNRANMGMQNLKNVEIREEGLADSERLVNAPTWDYSRVGNFGAVNFKMDHPSNENVQVRLIALDSLNLAQVDFIKMDIEGMEVSALTGAEKTIQKFRPVLFIENDRPEQAEALLKLLAKWNYRVETHHTSLFNPQNFKNQVVNIYANTGSVNILAIPR